MDWRSVPRDQWKQSVDKAGYYCPACGQHVKDGAYWCWNGYMLCDACYAALPASPPATVPIDEQVAQLRAATPENPVSVDIVDESAWWNWDGTQGEWINKGNGTHKVYSQHGLAWITYLIQSGSAHVIPAPFPPKPETVEAGWELTGECRIPHDQNEMHFPIYALGADLRWYSASRPVYGTRSAHATGFVGRRWIARRVEKPEVKKAVKTILAAEKISMAEARQVALHAQEEAEKRRQDYRELTGYDNDFDDIRPTVTSYDPGSEGLDTTVTTILGPLGADALNAMNPKETDMSNDLNLRCPKCGRHPEYPKDVLRFDSRRGEIRMCCPTCKGVSWLKPLDAANDASKPSQPVAQSPDALPWRYRWPLHGPYTAWLSFWNTIWSATGRWAALGAMASGVMLWAVGPERTWRVAVALGGYVKHLIGMVC